MDWHCETKSENGLASLMLWKGFLCKFRVVGVIPELLGTHRFKHWPEKSISSYSTRL